jgi:hypothetical protein
LGRVFEALRAFRLSREIQDPKARFLELARIGEHLAKKDHVEKLRGPALRERITRIATKGRFSKKGIEPVVVDLWDNVRNPLTHSAAAFSSLGRDSVGDLKWLEEIVIAMIRAVVMAWRNKQFGIDPYEHLLQP